MPNIPEGAKVPADKKPSTADLIASTIETPPEGAELLRPAIDIDFSEEAEFLGLLAQLRIRGESIELTSANLKAIGALSRYVQENLAVDSNGFKTWLKNAGDFSDRVGLFAPLLFWYSAQLGEGDSSAS